MTIKKTTPPTSRIYAFIGRDDFSIAEKIKVWMRVFREKHGEQGISVFDCRDADDGAGRLTHVLRGPGLFQTQSLVVVKNPWSAKSTDVQTLLSGKIESLPTEQFLVISDSAMDGRTGLAKALIRMQKNGAASIELFDVPSGFALSKWIADRVRRHGGSFEKDAAAYILGAYSAAQDTASHESDSLPINLWQLDTEMRKLVSHAAGRPITKEDVSAVASLPSSAHIFHLTDALLEKKYLSSLRIAHQLVGDDPAKERHQLLSLVAFLASQFHSFVLLKSMEEDSMNERDSAARLGWNTKRVWVVSKKIHGLTCAALQAYLRAILDFEKTLKTGSGDPVLHLDLLVRSITH
ncbi:DNA polymerase III subunit delta [Candidatus Uhrbacteria bacterium]|nr:DNA polymerase III subunit delta [Candidatus Uhrbacteria bacterium]